LLKKLPKFNFYLACIPRGPLCEAGVLNQYLPELKSFLKNKKVLSLRIEPSYLAEEARQLNLKPAKNKVLMNKTMQLDLSHSVEDLKAKFAPKTRQYINKSAKQTVIHHSSELSTDKLLGDIYTLYTNTANRAGFKIQSKNYYAQILNLMETNLDIYISYNQAGEPLAFLWNAFSKDIYFELYGGISEEGQALKANYALKFRAIQSAKELGCSIYDFNGRLNDGVSRFKSSFGPQEVDYVRTLQLNLSPLANLADLAESLARKA
jgi:lipid II:glycine glycyltransferase (peptidoglycan interpeptide bridge formation enzyme)